MYWIISISVTGIYHILRIACIWVEIWDFLVDPEREDSGSGRSDRDPSLSCLPPAIVVINKIDAQVRIAW
jgi:hypothetical protein